MSQFNSNNNKGFSMVFENGWTISVQFGYGNYCQNNHHPDGFYFSKNQDVVTSEDAEIANWINNEGENCFNGTIHSKRFLFEVMVSLSTVSREEILGIGRKYME